MGQTGIIFFALLVGFVVFVTLKNELGAYLAVMGLGTAAESTEAKAKRLAGELQGMKDEASRLNDSLKPIGSLPNLRR